MQSDDQAPPSKRPCLAAKSASARSRPIEGTLTAFLNKYGISKEEWDAGRLSFKGIAELPPLLPWPEGLTEHPAFFLSHRSPRSVVNTEGVQ